MSGNPDPVPNASTGWATWLQMHLDALGWNNTDLGQHGGFDRSMVGRWLNEGKQPTVESVRAVCRALKRDIKEGLVAAGIVTEAEMGTPPRLLVIDLRRVNDRDLLLEVGRRMTRGHTGDYTVLEDSLGEVLQAPGQPEGSVFTLAREPEDDEEDDQVTQASG